MEKCPICKFPFQYEDESSFRRCSEFCARASEKELEEFKGATPGVFCLYPCPECGGTTEGEWDPAREIPCFTCGPKVKLRKRAELLKEALPFLPSELRSRVEEAIK
jgi:hypothetical protein